MSEQKLTPWFPLEVKPVRRGVYETEFDTFRGFSRWTGKKWANQDPAAERARLLPASGAVQDKRWRGLAEDPNAR